MPNDIEVSVCVPVYGVEKYIGRCAESLFSQTMREKIEFIFVDDCSPDGSIAVVEETLRRFPERARQVRILHHDRNRGLVQARRTALAQARGRFIVHCDSDDWVDADLYERMHETILASGADVVFCRFDDAHMGVGEILAEGIEHESDPRRMILEHMPCLRFNSVWNKMFAREIACDPTIVYSIDISMGEDEVYTAQAIARCRKIAHCADSCCYHYVVNPASITGVQNRRPERARSLALVRDVLSRELRPRGYGVAVDRVCRDVLLAAVKCGQFSSAEYKAWRRCLKGPLLGDRRHGFVKKTVLCLAECSYRLAVCATSLFLR